MIVLTWENGRICQDDEIQNVNITIVFNKAKRCSLYGNFSWKKGVYKLMEINYCDVLLINSWDDNNVVIYNLTTKELIKNKGIRVYALEFRDE